MALPRANTIELGKLFNATSLPLYVLDEDLTLIFVNRAAQEWLQVEQSLVGTRCAYHSTGAVEGLEAVAAGLCPPPRVLAGETVVATVACTRKDGRLVERRVRFVPLGVDADNLVGVLAVLSTADLADDSAEAAAQPDLREADAIALHEQIRRFRREAASRFRADRLIGDGPAMRLVRRQVELAMKSRESVLLAGPPGSGRQHTASAIHYGAASGAWVPLDCSLLGVDLLETVQQAVTREKALGEPPGTLLFHRVDELSADVQMELASAVTRRPVSWRLIATSSEPLVELAQRGKFRDDLAAALSTITIELPSLARRREDLPLLAQLFLEEWNAKGGRQIAGFTPAALDLMDGYAWPGNLDELAQTVADSCQRAASREIDVGDLPESLRLANKAAMQPRRTEETIVLEDYLARVERELIRRALARAKGNKARAARLLGTTRPKLYRRMVQLGLESREGRRE